MRSLFFDLWKIKNKRNNSSIKEIILTKQQKISKKDEKIFFESPNIENLHSPKLFKDYEKALKRINFAIQNKENIIVFGDYDVDGTVGTVILFEALKKAKAKVSYRIPHRKKDGYGLKKYFIDEFKGINVKLVITVDTGISAIEEVKYANKLGVDVIITDHHLPQGETPKAHAIINPKQKGCKYPFTEICGATLAYKLGLGIAEKYFNKNEYDEYKSQNLVLVALATVADVMPLIDENRIIVKYGLKMLKNTDNKGLLALALTGNINLENANSETLGFQIGPRLNAGGRLSQAYLGVQLLLGETKFASELERLNDLRKLMVKNALKDIEQKIYTKNVIIESSPAWHAGIIGLIAGKLTEKYTIPTIILEEQEDRFVASCRAPEGFDIFDFLIGFSEMFENFGGHKQAAGFSISKDKYLDFKDKALKLGNKILEKNPLVKELEICTEIFLKELNLETYKEIELFEPFGYGNEKPVFILKNIKNIEWKTMGKEGDHLVGILRDKNNEEIRILKFFAGNELRRISNIQCMDLAISLSENTWNGNSCLQLILVDVRE